MCDNLNIEDSRRNIRRENKRSEEEVDEISTGAQFESEQIRLAEIEVLKLQILSAERERIAKVNADVELAKVNLQLAKVNADLQLAKYNSDVEIARLQSRTRNSNRKERG